jgi:outer membrane biosynthesis protein TonB
MEGKKLLRTLVWLVALGVIIVGLTMCTGTSPGPGATDAPVAVEPTQAAAAPPTAEPTETSTPEPTEAAATETPTAEPAEAVATETPTVEPTAEPTETPTVEPTEEPTEEPTGAPAVDVASLSSQNCVNCHTVQETLQALAEEKGVKSEASSGEG